MTLILDTTSTPYMSELEFLQRADVRTVAQLCSDTGEMIGSPSPTPEALVGNQNLLAALLDGCGELEACCLTGSRYIQTDLAQIAAATGTGAQAKMFRVLTRLTMVFLYERRMDKTPDKTLMEQSEKDKQALRDGEEIFGDITHEQAGLVQSRQNRRPRVVRMAGRFFGRASGRWGWSAGGYD